MFATKLIAYEFTAYLNLESIVHSNNPLSLCTYTITSYKLCRFANLRLLGIQIGMLSVLGPLCGKVVTQIALSAMICEFISTLQTTSIVYVVILYSIIFSTLILYQKQHVCLV